MQRCYGFVSVFPLGFSGSLDVVFRNFVIFCVITAVEMSQQILVGDINHVSGFMSCGSVAERQHNGTGTRRAMLSNGTQVNITL